MSDEPTGRIPAQIGAHSKRLREQLANLSGHLSAIKSLTADDRIIEEVGGIKMDLIGILAELNAIDASLAAGRMTGQVITDPRATDLELHPRHQHNNREHQLMLASMHRAGDHTLDREDADA